MQYRKITLPKFMMRSGASVLLLTVASAAFLIDLCQIALQLHKTANPPTAALQLEWRDGGWPLILAVTSIMMLIAILGLVLVVDWRRHVSRRQLAAAGEALARSEGMRAHFFEAVAHDLRQPIQAVELFAAGLERQCLDVGVRPMLDGIRSSLASMRRMLSGLMDVSRLDAGAIMPDLVDVPISDILGPISAEFAPAAEACGISFSIIDGDVGIAHSDPVILECILRNLVANSVHYTSQGSVSIRCAVLPAETVSQIAITISDTGPGIPESELERIFEEFYRVPSTARSTEGLGLGLAIVRRMIQLLDLSLEVSSTVGVGTTFTVLLPAARDVALRKLDRPSGLGIMQDVPGFEGRRLSHDASVALALAGARVLLVDDDVQVRRGLAEELRAHGMVVSAVASPAAVRALFTDEPLAHFDIALVDRDLGAELTGPQLLDHLTMQYRIAIPALILSGTQDFKVIAELQNCPYPWLAKPVSLQILLREMARVAGLAPDDDRLLR